MQLKEVTRELWGNKQTFRPFLLRRVWGDGMQYAEISPIFTRPLFYVVRIDSRMELNDIHEIIDEIYDQVEYEFGSCCETYSDSGECECDKFEAYPSMCEWGGSCWGNITEEEVKELGLPKINKKNIAKKRN